MSDENKPKQPKPKQPKPKKGNKLERLLDLLIDNEEAKHGEGARTTMLEGLKAIKKG